MAYQEFVAPVAGPIELSAELLGEGKIVVQTSPTVEVATVRVSTNDERGLAAAAVAATEMGFNPGGGLIARAPARMDVRVTDPLGQGAAGGSAEPIAMVAVLPEGSRLRVRTDRAEIEVSGPVEVHAETASGDVRIDRARQVTAETGSGAVDIDRAELVEAHTKGGSITVGRATGVNASATNEGAVTIRSADSVSVRAEHGAVNVGGTGDANVRTKSGAIGIGSTRGPVVVKSTTGDIAVRGFTGKSLEANTAEGSIRVHVSSAGGQQLDPRVVRAGSVSGQIDVTADPNIKPGDVRVATETPGNGNVNVPDWSQEGQNARQAAGLTAGDRPNVSKLDAPRKSNAWER